MKKSELVKRVAGQHGTEAGAAADKIDKAVNEVLRALRSGQSARLPGLGTITPGKRWVFKQDPDER